MMNVIINKYCDMIIRKLGFEHDATIQFFKFATALNLVADNMDTNALETTVSSYYVALMKGVTENEND